MNNVQYVKCCGCATCALCCPQNAISMKANEKGFFEAYVDERECISCGICTKVCASIASGSLNKIKRAYAYKVTDFENRMESQSGGAFFSIAKKGIEQGWVVYGVIYDGDKALYVGTEDIEVVKQMRGSKYIQALNSNIQKDVQQKIEQGKKVLFSGTPCMIEGIRNYLKYNNIDDQSFFAIDIICHGVPSPLVFNDYRKYLIEKYGKCDNFNFRDKIIGWGDSICSFKVSNKKYYSYDYLRIFYSDLVLNDSCYDCRYAALERAGDITVGDLWGIESTYPQLHDNYGVSLFCVNNKKGELLREMVCQDDLTEIDIQKCLQKNLYEPTNKAEKYNDFWDTYFKRGYRLAVNEYIQLDENEIEEMNYLWREYNLCSLIQRIKDKEVYLYGIGLTMMQLLDYLNCNGVNVTGILHRDDTFKNQIIKGIRVLDNNTIKEDTIIIICSKNVNAIDEISERLRGLFGLKEEQILSLEDCRG